MSAPMSSRADRRHVLQQLAALPFVVTLADPLRANAPPAVPTEIVDALPDARLQGGMRYHWLGLHVYDARLWTGTPLRQDGDLDSRPYALELAYARRLEGKAIAERSLDEMRRLETISATDAQDWLQAMRIAFPDVAPGDRLHRPGRGVQFLHNGRVTGEVAERRFARLFFGIWLSSASREPELRAQLLGNVTATR
jgi:hypothetical protein